MKLHLGCGNNKLEGYVNCDISSDVKPDKIVDLEKKLPFKDNSVDEIITNHTLEHIKNFMGLMEEIYRVCKNEAIIKIRVPYFAYPGAFQDPTHVRFFTLRTFDYFSPDNGLNYYSKARFEILETKLKFSIKKDYWLIDNTINSIQRVYERFFSRIFPCAELKVILKVKK